MRVERIGDATLFDSTWRRSCRVIRCSIVNVDDFVRRHYLHKRPAIVLLTLAMLHNEESIGCVVFSAAPREANKRYGGKVWELARLYLLDEIPKNAETWLIGQSVKYIRSHFPDVDLLLSYADPAAGHTGTIYKAANWKQDGRTDQERKTPRFDHLDPRTGKLYLRRSRIPEGVKTERLARSSKNRFILRLHPPNDPKGSSIQQELTLE